MIASAMLRLLEWNVCIYRN